MFGPQHLLHRYAECPNKFDHNQSYHYVAHLEELEEGIRALAQGDDFQFSFDLNEYDKYYLQERLEEILGPVFTLDFE